LFDAFHAMSAEVQVGNDTVALGALDDSAFVLSGACP
jgi:hypothetical protein